MRSHHIIWTMFCFIIHDFIIHESLAGSVWIEGTSVRHGNVNCEWESWSALSDCTVPCGSSGTKYRTRYLIPQFEGDEERCHFGVYITESASCNNFCHNGGTPLISNCSCSPLFKGQCCELCKLLRFKSYFATLQGLDIFSRHA